MNFTLAYKYAIATVLVVFYLALPTTIFAKAALIEAGLGATQESGCQASTVPCGEAPCHDEHGTGCCDTTSCNCACHAPLASYLRIIYAPVVVTEIFHERPWSLPLVYRHIFVPPQNIPATL